MYFKPKKRLGQNFLVDKNIRNKIINACGLQKSDIILEIGAGRGELTELLAQQAKKVYAIEIDDNLCEILKERFAQSKNLKIMHADILKVDFVKTFPKTEKKIKVIGNIPYYISTPILERLFKFARKFETVFLTVQKEFAGRIIAHHGSKDYSALSCFAQYHCKPRILFSIPATCFFPAPKVDSSFMKLEIGRSFGLSKSEEKGLFMIIRAAFNKRRKTLQNSLKGVVTQEKLGLFFERYRIRKDIRPESLSLDDFVNIYRLGQDN